jgi:large subunit ribosomal protein L12
MEYIYAAMLLHKAGQQISEESVKKVLTSAGITPDDSKVKALVVALDGVDIEKAIKEAVAMAVSAPVAGEASAEKKEEKPKEERVSEEKAAAGLGALFG